MKKYIAFISFIIILFICYLLVVNRPKSYELEYKVSNYQVKERYDADKEYYNFLVIKDDITFNFVSMMPYLSGRKHIKDISESLKDDALCVKPISEKDTFDYICYKNNEYLDKFLAGLETIDEAKKINRVANVDIYDKEHEFLIWNNKGYTSLNNDKKYEFLNKESYDNLLVYQTDKNLIIADYDQSRTFNKFYIYNNDAKTVDSWDIDYDISFDSYFMGDIDNKIYLFDKKNKVQYCLDIENKKTSITSDKNGAIYYDKEMTHKSLESLAYNTNTFVKENKYNFILQDDKLYLRLFDNEQMIRISDKKIDHIVYVNEDEVYYLVKEKLYAYHKDKGERLLLVNFEWNFTYLNKIFIFD